MTYRQKVFALAEELGVEIENNCTNIYFDYCAWAPDGYHFKEEQLHGLVISQYSGFPTEPLWKDMFERMQGGLEKCELDDEGYCTIL